MYLFDENISSLHRNGMMFLSNLARVASFHMVLKPVMSPSVKEDIKPDTGLMVAGPL